MRISPQLQRLALYAGVALPALVKVEGDRYSLDLRYATTENFLHQNVYAPFHLDECFTLPEARENLKHAEAALAAQKLKLVLLDCFRPLSVQRQMWKILPDPRYVGNPTKGGNHNRGAALDVTLANEQGQRVAMPTKFDDFTSKASTDYVCSPTEKALCQNRDRLKAIMTNAGFESLPSEWWHFQLKHPERYPVRESLDTPPAP
ncbi:MAG: M15 family metallopeptidase [Bdellovibrionales bacterium]|nr:M15 family metallopeptidase [Bdellovibrionales bacterium]